MCPTGLDWPRPMSGQEGHVLSSERGLTPRFLALAAAAGHAAARPRCTSHPPQPPGQQEAARGLGPALQRGRQTSRAFSAGLVPGKMLLMGEPAVAATGRQLGGRGPGTPEAMTFV